MAPRSRASAKSGGPSLAEKVDAAATSLTRTGGASKSSSGTGARSSRVSAQWTARLGLIAGLIEGTLGMMELMFGLTIVKAACQTSYKTLHGLSSDTDLPAITTFCIHVTANVLVLTWLLYRLSQKHLPPITITDMANKLNLWPLPRPLAPESKRMILIVFLLHFLGTSAMFLVQYWTDHFIFSFSNYYTEEKGYDFVTGIDMLLFAPLREEMTFRGLMFAIFYLRGVAFKVASTSAATPAVVENGTIATSSSAKPVASEESLAWTSSWKLDCVLASSVTFGLVHLLNLFGDRYTRTYIILQVFLGMTLGAFYCLRFLLSPNTMLETVLLHAINNAFSSFLPVEQELDLTDPMVSLPLMLTFVVYGTLAYQQYRKLVALPPQPFVVLQAPAAAPVDAAAATVQPDAAQPTAEADAQAE